MNTMITPQSMCKVIDISKSETYPYLFALVHDKNILDNVSKSTLNSVERTVEKIANLDKIGRFFYNVNEDVAEWYATGNESILKDYIDKKDMDNLILSDSLIKIDKNNVIKDLHLEQTERW